MKEESSKKDTVREGGGAYDSFQDGKIQPKIPRRNSKNSNPLDISHSDEEFILADGSKPAQTRNKRKEAYDTAYGTGNS